MRYTVDITIDLPRIKVIELYDNPNHMKKWQPELINFEPISGTPGQPGAQSRLQYKMGKREIVMVETITKNNLPYELASTYETTGVHNVISNRFEDLENGQTQWISENEFQFSGYMKLVSLFMRSAFPKQTLKFMNQFKNFAESQDR